MNKRQITLIVKATTIVLGSIILLLSIAYGVALWFKGDILVYVNKRANTEIKGKTHIADVDFTIFQAFPNVSISLKDVEVKDSLYMRNAVFMKRVYLQINIIKLLDKQIEVKSAVLKDCEFKLFKDSSGYTNMSAFESRKPKKDSTSSTSKSAVSLDLQKLYLDNVTLTFKDSVRQKDVHLLFDKITSKLKREDDRVQCLLTGNVLSKGMIFKYKKGPFLKDKTFDIHIDVTYDIAQRQLSINPSSYVENKGKRYEVDGGINLEKKPHKFALNIVSKDTDYDKALEILSTHLQKQLSRFDVQGGRLDCQVKLLIALNEKADPRAHVAFQVKNSTMRVLDLYFDQTEVEGTFFNQKDSLKPTGDENSIVTINKANFNYHGIACKAKGILEDLTETRVMAQAQAQGLLKTLHHFVDSSAYHLSEGSFMTSAQYNGPLLDIRESGVKLSNAKLKGFINIKEGHFAVIDKKMRFSNINSSINFNESDIVVSKLSCLLNSNPVHLNGDLKNILPFLLSPEDSTKVSLNLSSPEFDVDKMLVKPKSLEQQDYNPQKKQQSKWAMARIDNILNRIEMNFGLNIKRLHWHKVKNAHVKGWLTIDKHHLRVHDLNTMLPSGGAMHLNASYHFKPKHTAQMKVKAKLTDMKASELFYMFDDFKQKTVTHKNLEGKIDANISFDCELKDLYIPQQQGMNAVINLFIRKGVLKNFEPFKNLDRISFNHRDLMRIEFDEISNRFVLDGYELYIEKMQINSSAVSLFVEGTYSFKDKTDLSIKIPLSNLKSKHDSTYYHSDDSSGMNILLRAKEKDGKMGVSFDPFNKYQKDQQKN